MLFLPASHSVTIAIHLQYNSLQTYSQIVIDIFNLGTWNNIAEINTVTRFSTKKQKETPQKGLGSSFKGRTRNPARRLHKNTFPDSGVIAAYPLPHPSRWQAVVGDYKMCQCLVDVLVGML